MEDLKKELETLKTTVKADFIKEVEAKLEARDKALSEGSTAKANELKNELEAMGTKFQELYNQTVTEIKDARSEMSKIKDLKNDNKSFTLDALAVKMANDFKASVDAKGGDIPFGKSFKYMEAKDAANLFRTKTVGDMTIGNFSGNPSVSYANDAVSLLPSLLHIRQLLPVGVMSTEVFQYEVEGGLEGAAALAAEGVTVAQMDNDFTTTTATAYKIGGFYRVSEESLKDIPWMTRFLQTRGIERVMDAEDAELLTGTTEIVGLSVNALSQAVAGYEMTQSVPVNKFDALMFAITKLLANKVRANGILVSPQDMAMVYQSRATDGQYLAPGTLIWNGAQPYVHGVPLFVSNAVAADKFYVGDWSSNSAEILQRDGLSVNFYEQDGSNAVQGKVTIRIQERIALAIFRPTSFLYGDFSEILGSLSI